MDIFIPMRRWMTATVTMKQIYLTYIFIINVISCTEESKKSSASVCYDLEGKANIKLTCPPGEKIKIADIYTGVSRLNTCSPARWDCIVDEGNVRMCDDKSTCSLVSVLRDTQKGLFCGTGMITYMHVEYTCIRHGRAGSETSRDKNQVNRTPYPTSKDIQKFLDNITNREKFVVQKPNIPKFEAPSLPKLPKDGLPTLPGLSGNDMPSFPGQSQHREAGKISDDKGNPIGEWFDLGDTFTLICVSVGAVAGMIVIISIIAAVMHRKKQKQAERRRSDRLSRFLQRSMGTDRSIEMGEVSSANRGNSREAGRRLSSIRQN